MCNGSCIKENDMWPALRQVDAVLKVCLEAPNACKALAVKGIPV